MPVAKGRPHLNRHRASRLPTQQARAGMLHALATLYSDAPGLVGDAALAERERIRMEDEAKASQQRALPLRGGA